MKALMTEREQLALAAVARNTAPDGLALEIGTGLGGSARIMLEANPTLRLYTVDDLSLERRHRMKELRAELGLGRNVSQDSIIAEALEPFANRVRRFRNVADLPDPGTSEPYALLLIDGGHEKASALADLNGFAFNVQPVGGFLVMHDFGGIAGRGGVLDAFLAWRDSDDLGEQFELVAQVETLGIWRRR